MPLSPEDLYRRIGRLIEEAPQFGGVGPLSSKQMLWVGRAEALINDGEDLLAKTEFGAAKMSLTYPSTRESAAQKMMLALHRVLATAELAAPAGAQGAFIPVGSAFDAYAALAKIFVTATSDIFIVDPYMDDTVLLEFSGSVPEAVGLRLLSDEHSAKPSLGPAATRWKTQHPARQLSVRLAPPRTLHDRAILIDGAIAWTVTQSLKDLAKRSPAEIVRADDIAPLKIAAYDEIWNAAGLLV